MASTEDKLKLAPTQAPASNAGFYKVGKTIKYTNRKHPLANKIVKPGVTGETFPTMYPDVTLNSAIRFGADGFLILPCSHLSRNDIQVLTRNKTLIPAA